MTDDAPRAQPSTKVSRDLDDPNAHLSPQERYDRAIERRDTKIRDRRSADRERSPGRRSDDPAP
jgi:hypothetical protein